MPDGLATISTYTPLVFGRMAASTSAGSGDGRNVVSTPKRARVTSSKVRVPPYSWALAIRWSPAPASAAKVRNSADMPLEAATAPSPPSSEAMRSSNDATVGFDMRV